MSKKKGSNPPPTSLKPAPPPNPPRGGAPEMIEFFPLSFEDVAKVNVDRCLVWHPLGLMEWSALEWAGAMCGEAGEAANIAKKIKRVDTGLKGSNRQTRAELLEKLKKEIGDTYLYLDLMAQREGLRMEDCVAYAFNLTSEKEGFTQRL